MTRVPITPPDPRQSKDRKLERRDRRRPEVTVRTTRGEDFPAIGDICARVYPGLPPWDPSYLAGHRERFPEGQLVAVDAADDRVLGFAATLIVLWDDYDMQHSWNEVTGYGTFSTHDPQGRTLYGAEVFVDPRAQGLGVGKALYAARRTMCQRLNLKRIRAGARLRNYSHHADEMSADEYVERIIRGEMSDPTLSFQLRQGFRVLAVVPGYLPSDRDSLGWAAIIDWNNAEYQPRDD